jgi:hypothetical protein
VAGTAENDLDEEGMRAMLSMMMVMKKMKMRGLDTMRLERLEGGQ